MVKAVGLISGGLDSIVASSLLKKLGVDVHGMFCVLPFSCGTPEKAKRAAQMVGVPLEIIHLDNGYVEMLKNPRFGRGSAINPCIDCKIFMIKTAAEYMKKIEADFVFTGEILGQRPMSQLKHSLRLIEKQCGLEGRLLRPLSAKLLPPTIPETEGLIDREQLLNISGRSRRVQIELASKIGITEFPQPAGGCLLTDKNFGLRMTDLFQYGYRNLNDLISLTWGRHFRFNPTTKFILGRDAEENQKLIEYANEQDYILQFNDERGPTLILINTQLQPESFIFNFAAGLVQYFSKLKNAPAQSIDCWRKNSPHQNQSITAHKLLEEIITPIWLNRG